MDTVIYRIHEASKYQYLVLAVQNLQGKESFMSDAPVKKAKPLTAFMVDYASSTVIPFYKWDKMDSPSWNHTIPVVYNSHQDFIEINVSIPKFLLGNNVLESVIPPSSKYFTANAVNPFNQVKYWIKLIRRVFNSVLLRLTGGMKIDIDYKDVEIQRVDIAINQKFSSRAEALRYLNYQDKLVKKNSKINGHKVTFGTTEINGIAYKTDNYYVKIYHKGLEFETKQRPQINKIIESQIKSKTINYETNLYKTFLDQEYLQSYADCILRYEFTFRPSFSSYIYNNRLNKIYSSEYKKMKSYFNYLKRDTTNKTFVYKSFPVWKNEKAQWVKDKPIFYTKKWYAFDDNGKYTLLTMKQKEIRSYLKNNSIYNHQDLKRWMKFIERELGITRNFFIESDNDSIKEPVINNDGTFTGTPIYFETPKHLKYSSYLLYFQIAEIKKFFLNFQIEEKSTEHELDDKISFYNQKIMEKVGLSEKEKKKLIISKSQQRTIFQYHTLVAKGFTQRDLIRNKFSRSNYFRVKKIYEEITGVKHQIAHVKFGDVLRDFDTIFDPLYKLILFDKLSAYYNYL